MQNIFANGIELTDAELASLPIDIMAVWLDMWEEATREQRAEDAYNAFASEREIEIADLEFKYFGTPSGALAVS